ncbi:MAG: molecular chaperone DnaJ [Pseudomonadales bacterium]|jgi:hypothetical protein
MVIILAAIMAAVAFVILMRLLWVAHRPSVPAATVTLIAVILLLGLGILAATGRMHWIAALVAAIFPFLRRGASLLRYVPLVRHLFGAYQHYSGGSDRSRGTGPDSSELSPDQARQMLGLGPSPTRDEIIAAHRRLMQKIHPDRGGSTYLAQQLNEAKRILLKKAP